MELRPDEGRVYAGQTRPSYAPAMEYLIDDLLCPRGLRSIECTVKSWSSGYEIERARQSG